MRRSSIGFATGGTIALFILALVYLGWLGYGAIPKPTPTPVPAFDGGRALALAQAQCDFGPRPSGSEANAATGDWILQQLEANGWETETHEFEWNGTPVRNIIGRTGEGPVLMVGAHYDTRLFADRDPDPALQSSPVLGGNDGASGVAVLLELARVVDKSKLQNEVWLTFFDGEDNGRIEDWEWGVGSTRLAQDLAELPAGMILLDMIGDRDQRFPFEMNSNPQFSAQIWELAADLGYGNVFIPEPGQPITDDHIAFIERGVPAVDIIDFDYPAWHTTEDTCEQVAAASLARVGHVLEVYLEDGYWQRLQLP
ncbi:MAG: M28 family peptidase [Caldilineales bacterium]|nr:M28 family peptidase [Caldilineales bacterium]